MGQLRDLSFNLFLERVVQLEQEARLLKAHLQRMETQTKEDLERAGREVEKFETHAEALIEEVATLRKKLKSQERRQQELRQQYQQKLQQHHLKHETQLEEVSLQCTSLSQENDRKERQVERLRAYLQRITQRAAETDDFGLFVPRHQRHSLYPSNQSALEGVVPSSRVASRNATRREDIDRMTTQNLQFMRVADSLSADSGLVRKSGQVAPGSSAMLHISWLMGRNQSVEQSSQKPQALQSCSVSPEAGPRPPKCSISDLKDLDHRPQPVSVMVTEKSQYVPLAASPRSDTCIKLKETDKRLLLAQKRALLAAASMSFCARSLSGIRHKNFVNSDMALSNKIWPTTTANARRICTRSSCQSLQEELLDAVLSSKFSAEVSVVRRSRERSTCTRTRCQHTEYSSEALCSGLSSVGHRFHINGGRTTHEEPRVAPVVTTRDKINDLSMQRQKTTQPFSVRQILIYAFLLVVMFDISALDGHLQMAVLRVAQWTALIALSGIQNLKRLQAASQQEHLKPVYADTRTLGATLFPCEVTLCMRSVLLNCTERALLLTLKGLSVLQKSDVDDGVYATRYAEILTDQFGTFPANDTGVETVGINRGRAGLYEMWANKDQKQ